MVRDEERKPKKSSKQILKDYRDYIVEQLCKQDMDSGRISGQIREHAEITHEDSVPKLVFLATDINYFHQMKPRDLPLLYDGNVNYILVDDDIEQAKGFIKEVPEDFNNIMKNYSPLYNEYKPENDIAKNLDDLRKKVKGCLKDKTLLIILLNLNLKDSDKEGIQLGERFLRIVRNEWPQIPIFAITRNRDINTILRIGRLGANGYIYKPAIGLLPLYLGQFLKDTIGEQILDFLQDIYTPEDNHTNMVVQHITAWTNTPHVLWYGDKVPIMVEHGITHASNLWLLFNSLLSAAGDRRGFLKLMGSKKYAKRNVLAFMLSLWLHDIGHKGNEYYQSGPDVRSYHGAISALLIGARPDVYLPYFPYDKDNHWLDIIERIQVYCRFHSSNGPLDDESFEKLRKKGKLTEPYELGMLPVVVAKDVQSIRFSIPLCIKEDRVRAIKYVIAPEEMRSSVALFRFLDALDMRANRVGDPYYLKVKQDTVSREMESILRDIIVAGNNFEIEFSRLYPTYYCELIQIHDLIIDIKETIEDILDKQKKVNILRSAQDDFNNPLNHSFIYWGMNRWFESKKAEIDDKLAKCMGIIIQKGGLAANNAVKWRNLVDYFVMLSIQCKHYYLHKTFRDISFVEEKSTENIKIKYAINKPMPSSEEHDEIIRWIIDCAEGISAAWEYVSKEWKSASRYISEGLNISDITFEIPDNEINTCLASFK